MIQDVTLCVGRLKATAGQYTLSYSWFFEVLKFCETSFSCFYFQEWQT